MVAQQIDPDFASATAQKLAVWDLSQTQERAIEAGRGLTQPNRRRFAEAAVQPEPTIAAAIWNDLFWL
jgi:hypothetical protein